MGCDLGQRPSVGIKLPRVLGVWVEGESQMSSRTRLPLDQLTGDRRLAAAPGQQLHGALGLDCEVDRCPDFSIHL
jgi:hypothetical protein